MERLGLLHVLLFTAILITIASLLPDGTTQSPSDAPWNVTLSAMGNTRVLGVTLNESTIKDIEQQWMEAPEITVFMNSDDNAKVEAYFKQVNTGGIRASAVAEVSIPDAQLSQLISEGARIATQGDGSRKITLDGNGVSMVEKSTMSSLTYLPKSNLSKEIIRNRFGQPDHIFRLEEGIEHWIYPAMGLDITLSAETREVFQYVSPKHFDRLLVPLQQAEASQQAASAAPHQ